MNFNIRIGRVLFAIAFFCCVAASAQKMEFGNVGIKDLQEKFHPLDSNAPAAILFKKGKTYFKHSGLQWLVFTEVAVRIKIYNKEGYKYASHEISYYPGNGGRNVFSDGYTYNLEGGEIVKTKLGAEGEFTQVENRYTETKKIILPDVKEGSVIEYKYVTVTGNISYLQDWYFSYYIPSNYVEYTIALPAYFTYHSILSGNLDIKKGPQETAIRDGFQETRLSYWAFTIPAMRYEPHVDNIYNYRPHIKHELAASTSFAHETTEYTTSWKSFVKTIYEDEAFGKQLAISSYFKKDVDAVIKPNMAQNEKVTAIFKHVQSAMTWNEYGGFFCDEGVKKAYQLKKGNVADINLMLIAMLKYAGIAAEPVICSTISNGIPLYPGFPAFNYVIASVPLGGETVLMDATNKNTVPGLLPLNVLNHVGRKILPDGYAIETDLIPKKKSKSNYSIAASIDKNGKVSGKIRGQYFDYLALVFRESGLFEKEEEYVSALEKTIGNAQITDYQVKNVKDPDNPIVEDYSFVTEDIADLTSEKILISPVILPLIDNPFTSDDRMYPVNFIFPYQYKYSISLKLPEGYKVDSIPAPLSLSVGDNVLVFRYVIEEKAGQLQLVVVFEINQAIIGRENYKSLKEFYRKLTDKQKEKIVLKKA